ncbi:Glycosyl transferase, family 2 [Azotobacter vinelandii CA]|uniref:Glycosyl transferase, family 2 n=2 Tax=Azotobacter vinelandii TaxID=354 RepID=C1DRS8_AZOVD|nr:glycosyltransferase [Azotobacter vinelandii]ACO77816.1 Glycosyl transferase, family 2 [Azotobacter vinelandii DJ]AGK15271.1 Glycosyl transferase, family 2 [Azotobacter vinelandii CA]AGK19993.1 Glycosyl transferase, family 2 [Azotobacter vinelandii CA6]SFX86777.1 Glycosyltransferase involved in cell wall bisynthesis [Azotobacter vinelandii]GLK62491.1 glycosyl transferase [Azotobacter vinelandii]
MLYRGQRIALTVPCYNEEVAIGSVIREFRAAMPELEIYVFDNNSSDKTAEVAKAEGASVIFVPLKGKGNVVRRMFADVEADVYVMVDGDATYDARSVVRLVDKLLDERLDMVVGCRKVDMSTAGQAYRNGHQWGNRMLTQSVVRTFGGGFTDMLSGYRAFSRRYAKSFPALSQGFETETELTVHALELRMPYGEIMTPYGARPEGSVSKLSTYRDGWRILTTIGRLYVSERPLAFFGICAAVLAAVSVLISLPLLDEYLRAGVVPRLPTAILSASMMVSALLAFSCGLILDNVTRGRHEMKRLSYLAIPAPSVQDRPHENPS